MAEASAASRGIGKYRWTICALLLFATTINYLDRQVTSVLAPTLQAEFHWSETQYANITSWWTAAYAIGFLGIGRFIDKVGVRIGFAVAVLVWSIAGVAHGFVYSVFGFALVRFLLGLGESGNFPAAIKATAEWFPKHERAFATGIFNAGSNLGGDGDGHPRPMDHTDVGLASGVHRDRRDWLRVARVLARALQEPGRESATVEGRARVHPGRHQRTAGVACRLVDAAALSPDVDVHRRQGHDRRHLVVLHVLAAEILDKQFGVKLGTIALPLIVVYLVADVGSVGGGWLSGALIKRGWPVPKARKVTLLIAALLIVPTMLAPRATSLWVAVGIVSVAAAAHQWWSANLFTLSSDMFPRHALGSVVGLGGFAGATMGFFFQRATGWVLENNGSNYNPVFVVCGLAYVTALLIIHLLAPKMEVVHLPSSVVER